MEHTRIPVMGHAEGLCHTYVDAGADLDMAVRVTVDAKTQAYAVCNATETLLVHRDIAKRFLPAAAETLQAKGVRLLGDDERRAIIGCEPATEEDWATEYLAPVLSIKVVSGVEEAAAHINRYGSHHTDAIITNDELAKQYFISHVDSAGVYVNCSTRFADGYRYGFGAEVGISTSRLHARGPVGLEGLCTYKYILLGSGQIVGDYASGKLELSTGRSGVRIDIADQGGLGRHRPGTWREPLRKNARSACVSSCGTRGYAAQTVLTREALRASARESSS